MFKTIAILMAVAFTTEAFRFDRSEMSSEMLGNRVHLGNNMEQRVLEALERVLSSGKLEREMSEDKHQLHCGIVDDILRECWRLEEPTMEEIERIVFRAFRGLTHDIDTRDVSRMVEYALWHLEARRQLDLTLHRVLSRYNQDLSRDTLRRASDRLWQLYQTVFRFYDHSVRSLLRQSLGQELNQQETELLVQALHHGFETRSFFYYFAEQVLRIYGKDRIFNTEQQLMAMPERNRDFDLMQLVSLVEQIMERGSMRLSVHELTQGLESIMERMRNSRLSLREVELMIRELLGERVSTEDIDRVLRHMMLVLENRLERFAMENIPNSVLERLIEKYQRNELTMADLERLLEGLIGDKTVRITRRDLQLVMEHLFRLMQHSIDSVERRHSEHWLMGELRSLVERVLRRDTERRFTETDLRRITDRLFRFTQERMDHTELFRRCEEFLRTESRFFETNEIERITDLLFNFDRQEMNNNNNNIEELFSGFNLNKLNGNLLNKIVDTVF